LAIGLGTDGDDVLGEVADQVATGNPGRQPERLAVGSGSSSVQPTSNKCASGLRGISE
jgi:hypothetical protein